MRKNFRTLTYSYPVLIQENAEQEKFCICKLFKQWLHSKHQNPLKSFKLIKSYKCITFFLDFKAIFLMSLMFVTTILRMHVYISLSLCCVSLRKTNSKPSTCSLCQVAYNL